MDDTYVVKEAGDVVDLAVDGNPSRLLCSDQIECRYECIESHMNNTAYASSMNEELSAHRVPHQLGRNSNTEGRYVPDLWFLSSLRSTCLPILIGVLLGWIGWKCRMSVEKSTSPNA